MNADTIAPQFLSSATGLSAPGEYTRGAWLDFGRTLARSNSTGSWQLGDWLNLGERSFGSFYDDALEVTGLDYQTLRDVKSVCGKFPLSRRHDKLSFAHHRAVAALPPVHADELLERAEKEQLSVRAIRALAAVERDKPAVSIDPVTVRASSALSEITKLDADARYLLNSPHADRFRRKLEAHRVGPGTIADLRAALSEFAAEAAVEAMEPADDADLSNRSGYGRRVG